MVDCGCLMFCCLSFDDFFVSFWRKSIELRCPLIGEWCASVIEANSPADAVAFEDGGFGYDSISLSQAIGLRILMLLGVVVRFEV